jgi:excinuclease ABC subunit B
MKRRKLQEKYNQEHGIIPTTVKRSKIENLEETFGLPPEEGRDVKPLDIKKIFVNEEDLDREIRKVRKAMNVAAKKMQFEEAAKLRDELRYLEGLELLE